MRQTIHIPEYYVFVAKNSSDPKETYKTMITAYLEHNYCGYELQKIDGRTAVVEKVTR
jgi:hypothetical protein